MDISINCVDIASAALRQAREVPPFWDDRGLEAKKRRGRM